jgi:hypothetical protein
LKNLELIIPTHGRVNNQITLQALPTALQKEVTLVASLKDEAETLKRLYPQNTVLTAKGTTSIATKRHWIMQNVPGKILFMMDDDLAFFERCLSQYRQWNEERGAYDMRKDAPAGTFLMKRLYSYDKRLLSLFQELDAYAGKHKDLGMIGIAHRRHSDKKKDSWEVNARMMYCFGVNKELYKKEKIRFDAVGLREDFHVVLSMLEKGHSCHVFLELLLHNYGSFGAKGGCHDERSMAQSDEQCEVLKNLHSGFVKVMDRVYKGSIDRKEVVIAWKKAFESSKN